MYDLCSKFKLQYDEFFAEFELLQPLGYIQYSHKIVMEYRYDSSLLKMLIILQSKLKTTVTIFFLIELSVVHGIFP